MKLTVTAGHGGNDPGAVRGDLNERDLMARLRDIVALKAREAGHTVKTDGAALTNWPLVRALTLVPGSDVAIELHTNAAANPLAQGVEVIALPQHRERAQRVAQAIAQVLSTSVRKDAGYYSAEQHRIDRGWRSQAAFTRMGGMIVEVFFLSNPIELDKYLARYWRVASAIVFAASKEIDKP